MAKERDQNAAAEAAFLSGTARAKGQAEGRVQRKRPADPAPGATPEEAFLKGAAGPQTSPRRAPKRRAPTIRRPTKMAAKQWGCTKCGFSFHGDIAMPLCPMCEPRGFTQKP